MSDVAVLYSRFFCSRSIHFLTKTYYVCPHSWLVDRLATMFNIGGDLTITAVVTEKVGKDTADQFGEEEEDEQNVSTSLKQLSICKEGEENDDWHDNKIQDTPATP